MTHTVVVTGASGFVGIPMCELLARSGIRVRAVVRRESPAFAAERTADLIRSGMLEQVTVGDLDGTTDWSTVLTRVETVVHLAARVHLPRARDQEVERDHFRRVNVDATARLGEAAARAGVKRLVFVSSAKAETGPEAIGAGDPYSWSKAQAERLLQETSKRLALECVIVRPPLVYGPGVRANFLRLMRLVDSGVPIPLAGVSNRRSLVFVGNLVDALRACCLRAEAAGQIFSVSDGEDVSTPELIKRVAHALGRPARLFRFPLPLLRLAGVLIAQPQAIARLTGDLIVDAEPIRSALGWRAPYSMEQGLAETAAWFLAQRGRAKA